MSITNGSFTDTFKGFVSADSNLLIMRVSGSDTSSNDQYSGIIVGIKQ